MRKLSDSILTFIGGGQRPFHVGLSVSLGLICGFVAGWNATLATLLFVALAANARTRTLLLSGLAGFGLGWLLTPISFQIGSSLLDSTGLGDILNRGGPSLPIVLFDLDRYTLVGGLVLASLLALPAGWFAARSARRLAEKLHAAAHRKPAELEQPLHGARALACWCIYGGAPRALRAVAAPHSSGKLRLLAVLAMSAAAGAIYHFHGPDLLGRRLLARIAAANEAEAEASSIQFHLGEGRIVIRDLRLADPEHLDRDRLRASQVSAVVDAAALLRGPLKVQKLLLDDLQCDSSRETRARPETLKAGFATLPTHEPQVSAGQEAGLSLAQHLKGWKSLEASAGRLRNLIARLEELSEAESEADSVDAAANGLRLGFMAMRNLHCGAKRSLPAVAVTSLRASNLPGEWGLGSEATLEIVNLNSRPSLAGKATTIAIDAPAHNAELTVRLDLHKGSRKHRLHVKVADMDLAALLQTPAVRRTALVGKGRLGLSGAGQVSSERIDLPVMLHCDDLEAEVVAGQQPAGIAAATWNEGLKRSPRLLVTGSVEGNWKSPRLLLDPAAVVESWKCELAGAGEKTLVAEIERQLAGGSPVAAVAADRRPSRYESPSNDAAESQSTDYEALPQSIEQRAEPSRGMTSRGLDWRAKGGGQSHEEGAFSTPQISVATTPRTDEVDRYREQSGIGTTRKLLLADADEPIETRKEKQVEPQLAGDELLYPKAVLATDRAGERKTTNAARILVGLPLDKTTPNRDDAATADRPVIIQNMHSENSQATIRNLPSTEIVEDEVTMREVDKTSSNDLPGGLGLELGYDAADKKKTDRQVLPTAGSNPIVDSPRGLPARKELPQTAASDRSVAGSEMKAMEAAAEDPAATESSFGKFKNSVSSGFKKIMPSKRAEGEESVTANSPRRNRSTGRGSRGIFSAKPKSAASQPSPGPTEDDGSADNSQAGSEKKWYKFWR